MRPLSLATFAELEANGIPLSSLSGKDAAQKWAQLFAHLAGRHEPDAATRLLADLLEHPIAFKKFQHTIKESLEFKKEAQKGAAQLKKRTVKNPLEEKNMREEEPESEEVLDMTHLLLVSRMSGISLTDLSRMTFRGLGAVQEFLKDHPPDPSMASLLGSMG